MSAAAAAVSLVLDALVAVAIVDLAGFGVAQNIVGFGNGNKLFLGSIVTPIAALVSKSRGACDSGRELHTGSCQGETFWIVVGKQT